MVRTLVQLMRTLDRMPEEVNEVGYGTNYCMTYDILLSFVHIDYVRFYEILTVLVK